VKIIRGSATRRCINRDRWTLDQQRTLTSRGARIGGADQLGAHHHPHGARQGPVMSMMMTMVSLSVHAGKVLEARVPVKAPPSSASEDGDAEEARLRGAGVHADSQTNLAVGARRHRDHRGVVQGDVAVERVAGIVLQGLAECFISPRYLEFFSHQAPQGEEGLYLGFSHLHSFLSSILGFGISGYLLTTYCPDPHTLTPAQLVGAYDHAHYLWYYFAGIGFVAAIAMLFYGTAVTRIDRRRHGVNAQAEGR